MPTLAEVFALAERYGADKVEFNIETKLDPTAPNETVDPVTFARRVTETIREHGMTERVTAPVVRLADARRGEEVASAAAHVALAQAPTIFPGTPWTAGVQIDADAWQGGLADAARSIGAARAFAALPGPRPTHSSTPRTGAACS